MKYHVTAVCAATLIEHWMVEIPDDTPEDEIEDALGEQMFRGNAEFIDEEPGNEEDREITSFEEAE